MERISARSLAVAAIWVVGLVTLAVPGVHLYGPTGIGGLAASALPLVTTLAVLAALSPPRRYWGAIRRVGPSPLRAA